jgi:hypothetical protein
MKYDDASWHYEGDFPTDLPREAGATHVGMFLAWALLHGFAGELHIQDSPETLDQLRQRAITPGQFLILACDEKFTDEDLSTVGNAFAESCFAPLNPSAGYVADYEDTLGRSEPSLYHVPDTWETYDHLAPVIQKRFEEWQAKV